MLVNEIHAAPNHEQQLSYGHNNVARDVSRNYSSIISSDPIMLCLSVKPHHVQNINATSQEVVGDDQEKSVNVSDSNKAVSIRSGHYPINPKMAPSWFEQYGAFKNGNILPVNDAQKITAAKTMDQPFIIPNQSDSLHFQDSLEQVNSRSDSQLGSTRHSPMHASVESDNVCSQLSTPISEPDLHSFSSKKRKSSIFGLLSWHKELTQGSEGLRDLSAAELLWARTNFTMLPVSVLYFHALFLLHADIDKPTMFVPAVIDILAYLMLSLPEDLFLEAAMKILKNDVASGYHSSYFELALLFLHSQ
ncbi:hypothetical protein KIW84_071024 [Lathyrus oleraceus]|uniref:Uncharacterized protein n=1 Tax=Pisum sativum TaxID=3888 RepID=A0A9D4VIF0_PEA|nr:hypothetical protein KIW84_071024 [Pisum sativum]